MLSGHFPGSRGFCPKTRGSLGEFLYGVAEGDYFGLLAQIGWECAGAVEVMPSEDWALARASQELPREKRLTPEELSARLAALPSHP